MMKTDVRKITVTFGNGESQTYHLNNGGIMVSNTRIRGRIPGNPDAFTEVSQVSVHGELKLASNDAVAPSDPPKSNPDAPEEAE